MKLSQKQFNTLLWMRVLVWCFLIYYLSSRPNYSGEEPDFETLKGVCHFLSRKLAHLFEYSLLMVFLERAVEKTWKDSKPWRFLATFFFVLLYASSDEWHQSFVHGRTGEVLDVFIDGVGSLFGTAYCSASSVIFRWIPFLSALILITGCGKDREFYSAEHSESLGRMPMAIHEYEDFVRKNPSSPKVPEALFRLGEIYRTVIKEYPRARYYYDKVDQFYGKENPWTIASDLSYMNSPDYFPLYGAIRRTFGDSQSRGQNMRIQESMEVVPEHPSRYEIKKEIFAGDQPVGKEEHVYEKKDRELLEYSRGEPQGASILRYPPLRSTGWETLLDGKRWRFNIEEDNATIETRAGLFFNCIKVKRQENGSGATWKYTYYAPGIGPVLTSVATEKNETRVAELLSYEIGSSGSMAHEVKGGALDFLMVRLKSWIHRRIKNKNSGQTSS